MGRWLCMYKWAWVYFFIETIVIVAFACEAVMPLSLILIGATLQPGNTSALTTGSSRVVQTFLCLKNAWTTRSWPDECPTQCCLMNGIRRRDDRDMSEHMMTASYRVAPSHSDSAYSDLQYQKGGWSKQKLVQTFRIIFLWSLCADAWQLDPMSLPWPWVKACFTKSDLLSTR